MTGVGEEVQTQVNLWDKPREGGGLPAVPKPLPFHPTFPRNYPEEITTPHTVQDHSFNIVYS